MRLNYCNWSSFITGTKNERAHWNKDELIASHCSVAVKFRAFRCSAQLGLKTPRLLLLAAATTDSLNEYLPVMDNTTIGTSSHFVLY